MYDFKSGLRLRENRQGDSQLPWPLLLSVYWSITMKIIVTSIDGFLLNFHLKTVWPWIRSCECHYLFTQNTLMKVPVHQLSPLTVLWGTWGMDTNRLRFTPGLHTIRGDGCYRHCAPDPLRQSLQHSGSPSHCLIPQQFSTVAGPLNLRRTFGKF